MCDETSVFGQTAAMVDFPEPCLDGLQVQTALVEQLVRSAKTNKRMVEQAKQKQKPKPYLTRNSISLPISSLVWVLCAVYFNIERGLNDHFRNTYIGWNAQRTLLPFFAWSTWDHLFQKTLQTRPPCKPSLDRNAMHNSPHQIMLGIWESKCFSYCFMYVDLVSLDEATSRISTCHSLVQDTHGWAQPLVLPSCRSPL